MLSAARDLYRHLNSGAPLSVVSPDRIGPPLLHPLDPRHGYLAEEADLLAGHLAESGGEGAEASDTLTYPMPGSTRRMAAEDRPEYGGTRKPGRKPRRPKG